MLAILLAAMGTYYGNVTYNMPRRDGVASVSTCALGTRSDFEYDS